MPRRMIVACLLVPMAAGAPLMLAADDEKAGRANVIELLGDKETPATKPATQPATRPVRAEAKVTPEVQAVLDQVAAAYSKLSSLELAGKITLKIEGEHTKGNHESSFTSTFAAPNRFRHEGKDQLVLGGTGSKVYGYSAYSNIYMQADAPEGKAMLGDLPADHQKILAIQNLSLVLALSKDPAAELRQLASEITLLKDWKVDGQGALALQMKLAESENPMVAAFDPQTHLLKRVTIDRKHDFHKIKRGDVASANYVVDYTLVKPGAPTKDEQFAWKPPSGAKDFVAARAADAGDADEGALSALVGQPAPDFTLPDLDGNPVQLAKLKGSVVLLDFWATWCGPCVASMPNLEKIHKEYGEKGLKVYTVNQGEDKEQIQAFKEKKNLTMPVLMDKDQHVGNKLYGCPGIPVTVIIGKDGVVKKVYLGFDPEGDEAMRKVIEEELGKK